MEQGAPAGGPGGAPAEHHGGLAAKAPLYCVAILAACAVGLALPRGPRGPELAGIPFEFFLFGMTLVGVTLFHLSTLPVAVSGLASILVFKLAFTKVVTAHGLAAFHVGHHLQHEWVILVNLLCLLLGFALLSNHFEETKIPLALPKWLPRGWMGGFVLLSLVFILSTFLDNIAAAMIGATAAKVVFKGRVHIGFLAAIVAASNAGGAGSVVGDTTTTMMWISGVSPVAVVHAFAAAIPALLVCGIIAARQQDSFQALQAEPGLQVRIDWGRLLIVGFVLAFAITVNMTVNLKFEAYSEMFPFIGVAIAVALLGTAPLRRPDWSLIPASFKGSCFLLSLVMCASMMPVDRLPPASWQTAFGLGFLSAVFDNIPLTALGIKQGGYDWGMLAYTVGFGGSMIWFGSSAGVAVSNFFPEAKSVANWLRHGWHVTLAYIIGFFVMLALLPWNPTPKRGGAPQAQGAPGTTSAPADPHAGPGPAGGPPHGGAETKH